MIKHCMLCYLHLLCSASWGSTSMIKSTLKHLNLLGYIALQSRQGFIMQQLLLRPQLFLNASPQAGKGFLPQLLLLLLILLLCQ